MAQRKAAKLSPPKLTRGQLRYRRYLNADSGMSFKDWLKAETQRRRWVAGCIQGLTSKRGAS